jgi:hypothetical protein
MSCGAALARSGNENNESELPLLATAATNAADEDIASRRPTALLSGVGVVVSHFPCLHVEASKRSKSSSSTSARSSTSFIHHSSWLKARHFVLAFFFPRVGSTLRALFMLLLMVFVFNLLLRTNEEEEEEEEEEMDASPVTLAIVIVVVLFLFFCDTLSLFQRSAREQQPPDCC